MTLEQASALAQIFAAVAIVPSLVFVGLQLHANTRQMRIATAAGYYDIYRDHMLPATSQDFADIFQRSFSGQEDLNEVDRVRLNSYFAVFTRGYQVLHYQAAQNVFDATFWDGAQNHFADLLASRGFQQYWATRRHHFNPAFQAFTDDLIANRPKMPIWGLGNRFGSSSAATGPGADDGVAPLPGAAPGAS